MKSLFKIAAVTILSVVSAQQDVVFEEVKPERAHDIYYTYNENDPEDREKIVIKSHLNDLNLKMKAKIACETI